MSVSSNHQMTIYDISDKAGVSIATVSRVLNGSPNVSPDTKAKVLAVMEECEYTPNAFARGLGLNTMQTIGILCADSSDLYLAKAVYYIEQRLRQHQYDSILCCTGYELENKKSSLNLLISKKVDAVILIGSNFLELDEADNQYIREAAQSIPVMLLNASYEYPNVYSIFCDDFSSMSSVTGKMLDSGRKDILYLYNSHSYSGTRKLSGYKNAFESRGMTMNKKLVQFCSSRDDITECVQFLSNLYKNGLHFDTIVASEDILALAAIKFAKKQNLSIPEDLEIIGYNNSILTSCCDPELTSVDNKLETLCEQLVYILLGVLDGKDMPKKTEYSGELILRETTRNEFGR